MILGFLKFGSKSRGVKRTNATTACSEEQLSALAKIMAFQSTENLTTAIIAASEAACIARLNEAGVTFDETGITAGHEHVSEQAYITNKFRALERQVKANLNLEEGIKGDSGETYWFDDVSISAADLLYHPSGPGDSVHRNKHSNNATITIRMTKFHDNGYEETIEQTGLIFLVKDDVITGTPEENQIRIDGEMYSTMLSLHTQVSLTGGLVNSDLQQALSKQLGVQAICSTEGGAADLLIDECLRRGGVKVSNFLLPDQLDDSVELEETRFLGTNLTCTLLRPISDPGLDGLRIPDGAAVTTEPVAGGGAEAPSRTSTHVSSDDDDSDEELPEAPTDGDTTDEYLPGGATPSTGEPSGRVVEVTVNPSRGADTRDMALVVGQTTKYSIVPEPVALPDNTAGAAPLPIESQITIVHQSTTVASTDAETDRLRVPKKKFPENPDVPELKSAALTGIRLRSFKTTAFKGVKLADVDAAWRPYLASDTADQLQALSAQYEAAVETVNRLDADYKRVEASAATLNLDDIVTQIEASLPEVLGEQFRAMMDKRAATDEDRAAFDPSEFATKCKEPVNTIIMQTLAALFQVTGFGEDFNTFVQTHQLDDSVVIKISERSDDDDQRILIKIEAGLSDSAVEFIKAAIASVLTEDKRHAYETARKAAFSEVQATYNALDGIAKRAEAAATAVKDRALDETSSPGAVLRTVADILEDAELQASLGAAAIPEGTAADALPGILREKADLYEEYAAGSAAAENERRRIVKEQVNSVRGALGDRSEDKVYTYFPMFKVPLEDVEEDPNPQEILTAGQAIVGRLKSGLVQGPNKRGREQAKQLPIGLGEDLSKAKANHEAIRGALKTLTSVEVPEIKPVTVSPLDILLILHQRFKGYWDQKSWKSGGGIGEIKVSTLNESSDLEALITKIGRNKYLYLNVFNHYFARYIEELKCSSMKIAELDKLEAQFKHRPHRGSVVDGGSVLNTTAVTEWKTYLDSLYEKTCKIGQMRDVRVREQGISLLLDRRPTEEGETQTYAVMAEIARWINEYLRSGSITPMKTPALSRLGAADSPPPLLSADRIAADVLSDTVERPARRAFDPDAAAAADPIYDNAAADAKDSDSEHDSSRSASGATTPVVSSDDSDDDDDDNGGASFGSRGAAASNGRGPVYDNAARDAGSGGQPGSAGGRAFDVDTSLNGGYMEVTSSIHGSSAGRHPDADTTGTDDVITFLNDSVRSLAPTPIADGDDGGRPPIDLTYVQSPVALVSPGLNGSVDFDTTGPLGRTLQNGGEPRYDNADPDLGRGGIAVTQVQSPGSTFSSSTASWSSSPTRLRRDADVEYAEAGGPMATSSPDGTFGGAVDPEFLNLRTVNTVPQTGGDTGPKYDTLPPEFAAQIKSARAFGSDASKGSEKYATVGDGPWFGQTRGGEPVNVKTALNGTASTYHEDTDEPDTLGMVSIPSRGRDSDPGTPPKSTKHVHFEVQSGDDADTETDDDDEYLGEFSVCPAPTDKGSGSPPPPGGGSGTTGRAASTSVTGANPNYQSSTPGSKPKTTGRGGRNGDGHADDGASPTPTSPARQREEAGKAAKKTGTSLTEGQLSQKARRAAMEAEKKKQAAIKAELLKAQRRKGNASASARSQNKTGSKTTTVVNPAYKAGSATGARHAKEPQTPPGPTHAAAVTAPVKAGVADINRESPPPVMPDFKTVLPAKSVKREGDGFDEWQPLFNAYQEACFTKFQQQLRKEADEHIEELSSGEAVLALPKIEDVVIIPGSTAFGSSQEPIKRLQRAFSIRAAQRKAGAMVNDGRPKAIIAQGEDKEDCNTTMTFIMEPKHSSSNKKGAVTDVVWGYLNRHHPLSANPKPGKSSSIKVPEGAVRVLCPRIKTRQEASREGVSHYGVVAIEWHVVTIKLGQKIITEGDLSDTTRIGVHIQSTKGRVKRTAGQK